MYYDHGLLMSQRIELHHMMAGDLDMQLKLKDAVLIALTDHSIRGVDLVETQERFHRNQGGAEDFGQVLRARRWSTQCCKGCRR